MEQKLALLNQLSALLIHGNDRASFDIFIEHINQDNY